MDSWAMLKPKVSKIVSEDVCNRVAVSRNGNGGASDHAKNTAAVTIENDMIPNNIQILDDNIPKPERNSFQAVDQRAIHDDSANGEPAPHTLARFPPRLKMSSRTSSTADRLKRQGFRASGGSNGKFAVRFIKRGSDDWRSVIKPFVSDLAFRSCVTKHYQGEICFCPFHCQAAVLFVDLSGYSKVTAAIAHRGAHALSGVVNSYLSKILKVVQQYGGDVIKFAGDAVMIVWEGTQDDLQMNVLAAAKTAMDIQKKAASYPIEGTDLIFKNHCAVACGPLESEIFEATVHTNMQRLYHSVGGDSLYEISELVDLAAAGEVCISATCVEYLGDRATLRDIEDKPVECAGAMLLENLKISSEEMAKIDNHIENILADRMLIRNVSVEEDFIHPTILKLLSHGGQSPTQISQMRNLCVLFIAMNGGGSAVNWLMEVQGVLDQQRCPIVQIIDDDKGVHVIAAINLYESIPEASVFGLTTCQRLMDRQVGCNIGIAMGPTFCGVTGSKHVACRWDITGPPAVRAARLMQYAMANDVPVAVDESLYAIPVASGRLEILESEVKLKGSKKPISVYQLSKAKIQCAFRLLETVHGRVHCDKIEGIAAHFQENVRGACIVTGLPLAGKKILCQRVAGFLGFVPILHVADPTHGLLQLATTIATWFRYTDVDEVVYLAESVMEKMERFHWNAAYDESIRLVNTALENGLNLCVVVDKVQFLDTFSLSLMRDILHGKRKRNRKRSGGPKVKHFPSRLSSQSSSQSSSGHLGEQAPDTGKISFFCVHTKLFHWNSADDVAKDIKRSHRFIEVPICEINEVEKEDLKRLFLDLSDMKVEDRWLNAYSESSGFCAGYFVERAAASRNVSARLWAVGKQGLAETSLQLILSIPPGLSRWNRSFTVTDVNADLGMRFSQMYDELPPLFQMVVKVVAVATGKGYFLLSRFILWECLNDLIAEGVEAAVLEIVLGEMVDLHLMKQGFENEEQVYKLRCPGMVDISLAVCTPVQLSAIRVALLERLEPIQLKSFRVPLVMADLYAELKQKEETMKSLWQLGYAQMLNGNLDNAGHWKELIQDEIRYYGYSPYEILGEEMDLSPIHCVEHTLPLLKVYTAPISLGPMGTSLIVLTRNTFQEWSNFHGAPPPEIAQRQKDNDSAAARYIKQVEIIETALHKFNLEISATLRQKEKEWIEYLRAPATSDKSVLEKAKLFLDHFVPQIIEDRLQRMYKWTELLRSEPVPSCLLNMGDQALIKAYTILSGKTSCSQSICRQDAAQHALMVMASMGWQPRPLPEYLPIIHQQSVARIRNKALKRLTPAEKVVFRHQQTVDDFECFIVVTALLHLAEDTGKTMSCHK